MKAIVKWAFIVFVAGFVGQFGKSLTKYILRKIRKRKAKKTLVEKKSKLSKLEKKRLKAEIKKRNKPKLFIFS